jgi:hypothetical protein
VKRLKSFLGYSWAVIVLILVLINYIGVNDFGKTLASVAGLKPSPWFGGGENVRTIDHGTYRTVIHSPVFNQVLGQKKKGLLMIKWGPLAELPAVIFERIDYNGDGKADFIIALNTKEGKTKLVSKQNPSVLAVRKAVRLSDGWAARVILKRELEN